MPGQTPEWLAGAGGIEPCNNPLLHKDFSIPARPFDSIFDSKAKALVGMTGDELAYIEAKRDVFKDVVDALLGEPYVEFTRRAGGTLKEEHRRRPDSIWYGPRQMVNHKTRA